jgi:hypothetical protein
MSKLEDQQQEFLAMSKTLIDELRSHPVNSKEETRDAQLKLGDFVCTYVVLAGLTIQAGLSWWWWLAAFVGGWAINMAIRYAAVWTVRRRWARLKALEPKWKPPSAKEWNDIADASERYRSER